MDQWSATTAQEIVVFVTRQDLYKKRAKQVFDNNVADIKKNAPKEKIESRIKKVDQYYNKISPTPIFQVFLSPRMLKSYVFSDYGNV